MDPKLSDTQIRADLRSLMAANGIDANKTAFSCTRGVVRFLGELRGIYGSARVLPAQVGALEQSIRGTRGVARVHFDLKNWERRPNGQWAEVRAKPKK